MEHNEIIKALECCTGDNDCNRCPYWVDVDVNCFDNVKSDALALITSQEQRIKELTAEYESMANSVIEADELIRKLRADKKELTEENERLKTDLEIRNMKRASIFEIADAFERGRIKGKADTVREMHSMLCEGRVSNDNVVIVANQIAKDIIAGVK